MVQPLAEMRSREMKAGPHRKSGVVAAVVGVSSMKTRDITRRLLVDKQKAHGFAVSLLFLRVRSRLS